MLGAAYTVDLGDRVLRLQELRGADVLAVSGSDTRATLALIDRLIAPPADTRAAQLTAPERDRVLAEIHRHCFGSKVTGSPRCAVCEAMFDSDFEIGALVAALWPQLPARQVVVAGHRFRVPTGEDELDVEHLAPAEAVWALTRRCALDGDVAEGGAASGDELPTAFASALSLAAPVLDLDLSAVCPECGADNQIAFRMQAYLVRLLAAERARLASDIDILARAYGWSPGDILDLPRGIRLELVRVGEPHAARSPT